jgi:hypothetical protein
VLISFRILIHTKIVADISSPLLMFLLIGLQYSLTVLLRDISTHKRDIRMLKSVSAKFSMNCCEFHNAK